MENLFQIARFMFDHWFLTMVCPFVIYIFIFDKNKEDFTDEGEAIGHATTESEAKVKMWRKGKNYPHYDLDLQKHPDGSPGHFFRLEHWRRIWEVIFLSVPVSEDDEEYQRIKGKGKK